MLSGPYVLSCAQMRAADREITANTGLPSLLLMENAGRGVAEVILRRARDSRGSDGASAPVPALTVTLVCGVGNNGGDGFVAARHLALAGCRCRVLLTAPPQKASGDAAIMLTALEKQPRVVVVDLSRQTDAHTWERELLGSDVIVDAIFGTGLRDAVTGVPAAAIAAMNTGAAPATGARSVMKISVDIPSGLDGDTGRVHGLAVKADVTVTIASRKLGLVIDPEVGAGDIEVVDFGASVAPDPRLGPFCYWTEALAVRAALPWRDGHAYKGTAGHLIVLAGSRGKTGAALLAARSALRAGSGLVTIASTAAGQVALDGKVVEAMTASYTDGDDATAGSFDLVAALLARPHVRALALGPGIPTGPGMQALVQRLARETTVALVLDADALNLLGSDAAASLADARGPRIVTPHAGEMARLTGLSTAAVQADRLRTARDFSAASGAVVILKGPRTLVVAPDGSAFINPAVEPALATAGSGDVLTGIVGALLSQGMEPLAAARSAVFLHGRAGAQAARRHGVPGVIAGDLPEAVAEVRASWSSGAKETR